MLREAVGRFVLRTFLWLPVCFGAWYALSRFHSPLVGAIAQGMVGVMAPGVVTDVETSGASLDFVTRIAARAASGEAAVLVPQVDPLTYTYGLALFAALMLASRAKWWMFLAGVSILLPFEAWSIAFDFLVQVGVKAGPEAAAQAGLAGWKREVIALGYQMGALIFPALMPLVVWAGFNRRFLALQPDDLSPSPASS